MLNGARSGAGARQLAPRLQLGASVGVAANGGPSVTRERKTNMVRNADWNWDGEEENAELAAEFGLRRGAMDLLPWADPYIAMLIASLERGQLQAEAEGD